ncbi:hypothetical protein [Winogradskyella psychrotolerans]|uniref:hypothetical protein n=1 Tax=Winogradskyella psychrotolerans TaxID=1344585 RepID=UPI001C07B918|nr:hypothetical protein [Winogradskyella psychrotolerans]MBU2930092.1 hypothetical protein [Winogradskyella psychrotolerans]
MKQSEFLEQHIFNGLENVSDGFEDTSMHYFSESDFDAVLKKAEHFGLSIYKIETFLDGKAFDTSNHDAFKKKATDPKWYTKAFSDFKKRQEGLVYAATYKVSKKLLDRE